MADIREVDTLPEGFEFVDATPAIKEVDELPEGFEFVDQAEYSSVSAFGPEFTKEGLPPRTLPTEPASAEEAAIGMQAVAEGVATPLEGTPVTPGQMPETTDMSYFKTAEDAASVVTSVERTYDKYSTILKQVRGTWNPQQRAEAQQDIANVHKEVVDELSRQGFKEPKWDETLGEFTVVTAEGLTKAVDTSFLEGLYKSKYEIGGAIAGGRAGALAGARLGPWGAIAGGVVGSATGAFGGRGVDILSNQVDLAKKVDNKLIFDQMKEAGIMDPIANALGAGVIKAVGGAGRFAKHIFNMVYDSNIEGAYKFALNHYGVTEAEARKIVSDMEDLVGPLRAKGDKEKAIEALALSRAGGEDVIQPATIFSPSASRNVAQQIFKRAEDLKASVSSLGAENIQRIVGDNLTAYMDNVKEFYGAVKEAPMEFIPNYQFNYNEMAIQPILEHIGTRIENPIAQQRFANILNRIGHYTETRTFEDLVDLRIAVNDMKYSSKSIKPRDTAALNRVLGTVDNEIDRVANELIPEGKAWKDSFDLANKQYHEMKKLEGNVLYKVLTRKGIDEKGIVKFLSKYISAGDDTFIQVMQKLPKNVRDRVEGSVLDHWVEKFSAGEYGGNRAVHFPLLSKELKTVSWQSPKAKQMVRTVNRMADVFRNDVALGKASGRLKITPFQSYLTADPVQRLKYSIASKVFSYVRQLAPGDEANAIALVKNTAKLFENPLDNKAVKDMMRRLPKERREFRETLSFEDVLNKMQQEFIRKKEFMRQYFSQEELNKTPRLVWQQPRPHTPEPTELPSGPTLYGSSAEGGRLSTEIDYSNPPDFMEEYGSRISALTETFKSALTLINAGQKRLGAGTIPRGFASPSRRHYGEGLTDEQLTSDYRQAVANINAIVEKGQNEILSTRDISVLQDSMDIAHQIRLERTKRIYETGYYMDLPRGRPTIDDRPGAYTPYRTTTREPAETTTPVASASEQGTSGVHRITMTTPHVQMPERLRSALTRGGVSQRQALEHIAEELKHRLSQLGLSDGVETSVRGGYVNLHIGGRRRADFYVGGNGEVHVDTTGFVSGSGEGAKFYNALFDIYREYGLKHSVGGLWDVNKIRLPINAYRYKLETGYNPLSEADARSLIERAIRIINAKLSTNRFPGLAGLSEEQLVSAGRILGANPDVRAGPSTLRLYKRIRGILASGGTLTLAAIAPYLEDAYSEEEGV
jgi:hypothetical protein